MRARLLLVPVSALLALLAWAEVVHWRASLRRLGVRARLPERRQVVVVLGYRDRGPRANLVNRYRVRAGLRSFRGSAERVLVLSGGSVAAPTPEAVLMETYARERGYQGEIRLDTESRTTWENVANVIEHLEDADTIVIASNSLHAERARDYLWQQRPDLARRLRMGCDYRVGEILHIKPVAAVAELWFRVRTGNGGASLGDQRVMESPGSRA